MTQHIHASATWDAGLQRAVAGACARVAPCWPLDQLIAVNPYLGFADMPIAQAAEQLARLGGARLLMPRSYYLQEWRGGRLRIEHLQAAVDGTGSTVTAEALRRSLESEPAAVPRFPLIVTLLDELSESRSPATWADLVTRQIGQHCAAFFDTHQASWGLDKSAGLYPSWQRQAASLLDNELPRRDPSFAARVARLPDTPAELLSEALRALGMRGAGRPLQEYLTALLLSVNGWASWCAYEGWQERLRSGVNQDPDKTRSDPADRLVHLLAIRLAWEWLLYQGADHAVIGPRWHSALQKVGFAADRENPAIGWLLQRALEHAYQQPLADGLLAARPETKQARPVLHAVFCIDVRSERFRRALESVQPGICTLGFAGFFGLPIAYSPVGTALRRPQLPGLLLPRMEVTESCVDAARTARVARSRGRALRWREVWQDFRGAASSGFSFVESCGLLYGGRLLAHALGLAGPAPRADQVGLGAAQRQELRPQLQLPAQPGGPEDEARCDLAAGVLTAMGLVRGHARLVLLAAHGSRSTNNPQGASLDCGACGGQSGEINTRVLAALLNDPRVRRGLLQRGIEIPADTLFLAGLHNTTTDELILLDEQDVPPAWGQEILRLRQWLCTAGDRVRAERAESLDLAVREPEALKRRLDLRARDWAEVRPEWGLANNAAFIVAPRSRTRHLDLSGRAFLHEYCWQDDPHLRTLELIMTAPMIVTSWINLQYYASTVDNLRYGSGNKVLHNVVGGRLGVFEGNGGDLRTGLSMQSLHDGRSWRHTPLRLSVFIEAPRSYVEHILRKHPSVLALIEHEWIHLFQIDGEAGHIFRYQQGCWQRVMTRPQGDAPMKGPLSHPAASAA